MTADRGRPATGESAPCPHAPYPLDVPPTRDRPGLLRVRLENRWRWHVVDPSLDVAAADAAVAELRRRNAGTNVGLVRRVVRYAPLLAFVLVVVVGSAGLVVCLEAAMLTEPLAEGTVGVVGGVAVLVAAGFATWGVWTVTTLDLPMPVTAPGVVAVDDDVLGWVTDGTPAADVWRLNEAVGLCAEFSRAVLSIETDLGDRIETDELVPVDELDAYIEAVCAADPGLRALAVAEVEARAALSALARTVGFDATGVLSRTEPG